MLLEQPNPKAFQQTICDLKYHADVLDLMGLNENSVMAIHGGGMYGDKEKPNHDTTEQYIITRKC